MKVKKRSHGDEDDKLTIEDVIQLGGDQVRVVSLPVTLTCLAAYHRPPCLMPVTHLRETRAGIQRRFPARVATKFALVFNEKTRQTTKILLLLLVQ